MQVHFILHNSLNIKLLYMFSNEFSGWDLLTVVKF